MPFGIWPTSSKLGAERTRNAARQMFVYVSVLFTVAQTVAFTSFGQLEDSRDGERSRILISGLVAAAALAFTGVMAGLD